MIPKINTLSGYLYEYQKSVTNPEAFWENVAQSFYWRKKWDKVLEWDFVNLDVKWFVNGKLNITENIFEKNLFIFGDKPAIVWEPNNPSEPGVTLTYRQLHEKVCQFANVLLQNGVKKGDRVCVYMPMVPEAAVAMLACARIGAVHSVVFAGFSANSLADRINDAEVRVVLTSDGNFRGAKSIPVKAVVDEALERCPLVDRVIVLKRTSLEVTMKPGRDVWWHDAVRGVPADNKAAEVDSEDNLFVLYTSGSTGKPKGVVHTTGGYMVYTAYTFANVFQYDAGDVYFCTADVGWVTGHSYIVYGPLLNGATVVMFEGVPNYPGVDRFWDIIEKHKVTHFYTAPTAIRSLMGYGTEPIERHDLGSL
ncbi:MAG TPA: AMP-binding protein, partial [Cytophagales bacterium]